MDTSKVTLLSPTEVWDRVDPLAPDLGADPAVAGLADLPYGRLGGLGFERLCYELLVAEGHSPRFFGRSGQRDYGVDIVVEAGEERKVYQCKNLGEAPSWTAVRDAVTKFEADWLGEAGLPRPTAFLYCCPYPLDDRKLGEEWTKYHDAFKERTGVAISFWDKDALDARLKRLPDLVAGLFSNSYAEHFCRRDDWHDSPWIRVHWGTTGYASIKRFLDYRRQGRIQVSAADEERFMDTLSASPFLAIRGLPGAGKSMTGLELACRMTSPLRRIYYATLKDTPDPQRLWQSVDRRRRLPCLFLLDDCHLDLELSGRFLQRLGLEGGTNDNNLKVVLVLRDLPTTGDPDDTPAWLAELEQDTRVLDMRTDLKRTKAVAEHLRPELVGLSKQRLERLHHQTGGDLLLLDEQLRGVSSPRDLDELRPEGLYAGIRDRYFGGPRRLPTVRKLACLAQFDLVPLASFLDDNWQVGEKELAAPLMTELFAPPRYQFLHASIAELLLRALIALEVCSNDLEETVVEHSTGELIAYFRSSVIASGADVADADPFIAALKSVLATQLKLCDGKQEVDIKSHFLADGEIFSAIQRRIGKLSFSLLSRALKIVTYAGHPSQEKYVELVSAQLRQILVIRDAELNPVVARSVPLGLICLSHFAPRVRRELEDCYGLGAFWKVAIRGGVVDDLFLAIQHFDRESAFEFLEKLDHRIMDGLTERTIAAGCSIGTLSLAMRELHEAHRALLGRLEQAVGAERFLALIKANGTLSELFKILQYATPNFREALLNRLDEPAVETLVNKTIDAGRSIGTLSLAMRELDEADPDLLGRLEQAVGAARFLALINSTLSD